MDLVKTKIDQFQCSKKFSAPSAPEFIRTNYWCLSIGPFSQPPFPDFGPWLCWPPPSLETPRGFGGFAVTLATVPPPPPLKHSPDASHAPPQALKDRYNYWDFIDDEDENWTPGPEPAQSTESLDELLEPWAWPQAEEDALLSVESFLGSARDWAPTIHDLFCATGPSEDWGMCML